MENNIVNFFIEVKDDSGKWHLVKWMSDYRHFVHEGDIFTNPEKTVEFFEDKTTPTGQIARYVYNREINVGDGLFTELQDNLSIHSQKLPDDISDELENLITNYGSNRNFLYVIYLNELQQKSTDKIVKWKYKILNKASEKNDDDYYPDTLEYVLDEDYYDAFSIEYEIQALREHAKSYSNNRFIKDEDIRLYYYFC